MTGTRIGAGGDRGGADSPGTALVNGAAGFLGRYLVDELARQGWRVVGADRIAASAAAVPGLAELHCLELDSHAYEELVARLAPELIVHSAGPASVPASMADPAADFRGSVDLALFLLDCVRRRSPATKVVYFSSAAVYGNPERLPISETSECRPISPYGYHKLMCERLVEEYHRLFGVRACAVRIFSAYGPGLARQVLWDIAQKSLRPGVVELFGTGRESRDFIHARDIARAVARIALHAPFAAEAYNLASGEETTIADVAGQLRAALGADGGLSFSGQTRPGDPARWRADVARLVALGFRPEVRLADGILGYARWIKDARDREAGA